MKRHTSIGCFAFVLGLAAWSHAQAIPTASARLGTIQVGVSGTFAAPDYTTEYAKGITAYGDFDFTHHLGVEADLHFASIITPSDVGENTYLIGPRYIYQHRLLNFYAKALFGIGQFQFQQGSYGNGSSATYGLYSLGGGLDIRAARHLSVRAVDFEYQQWPNFPPHGLSPTLTTFGVAYVFH